MARGFFGLGTLLYIQFFIVYGSCNWFASQSSEHYRFFFDWEQQIPFVPQFIYIYLSLSLFIILPLCYLQHHQLKPWAKSYMWMTFVAGLVFILLPTKLAAARSLDIMQREELFALLYSLDLPHNLFPSLHVGYTSLALLIIVGSERKNSWIWLILGWWLLLMVSVLLMRQHYLADIIGGLLLAMGCYRYIYLAGQLKDESCYEK